MKSILFKNALYETAQLESISFFNTKAYISLLFDFLGYTAMLVTKPKEICCFVRSYILSSTLTLVRKD